MKFMCVLQLVLYMAVGSYQLKMSHSQLQAYVREGTKRITEEVNADNEKLKLAIEAFSPINAACKALSIARRVSCIECIAEKCTSRYRSICYSVEDPVLDMVNFVLRGISQLFTIYDHNDSMEIIKDEIIDFIKSTYDFTYELEEEVRYANEVIMSSRKGQLNSAVKAVIDINKGFDNLTNNVSNSIADNTRNDFIADSLNDSLSYAMDKIRDSLSLINKDEYEQSIKLHDIEDILTKVIEDVLDVSKIAVNTFSGAMRYPANVRLKRYAEPTCDELNNTNFAACLAYTDSLFCESCQFNRYEDCEGWPEAVAAIKDAKAGRSWLNFATDAIYSIKNLDVDYSKITDNDTVQDMQATTYLFGQTFDFFISEDVELLNTAAVGSLIAQQTVENFKAVVTNY